MKSIVILGSTGSIGKQTIEVVKRFPDRFRVVGLSAWRNVELLAEQARELRPLAVAVAEAGSALYAGVDATVLEGPVGLVELAALPEADLVVNGLVGSVGLAPTLSALGAGKRIALANKESMVAGGDLVIAAGGREGIVPVDSEHSAIFQCLLAEKGPEVRRLVITGSGGPFRGRSAASLRKVTVEEALAHPRWRMGPKISIDSATLMNKGLEVIEAHYLFDVPYDQIEVLIHPESIIHSMVEFVDGSIKAHLGRTDMRIPIQYALSYPERLASPAQFLDLVEVGQLTFERPDLSTFPCLGLALEAAHRGKTYPAVLSAANEQAVAAFRAGRISFAAIAETVEAVLGEHDGREVGDLGIVLEAEAWARRRADEVMSAC